MHSRLPMPAKRKFSHRLKRFRLWLKQVILLGRIDWRKASDDARPPRMSHSERKELQPHFDVNAIRPRSVTAADRVGTLSPTSEPAVPAPPPEPVVETIRDAPETV